MNLFALFFIDTKCEYDLPNEAEHTSDFIIFIDELFQSLYGNSKTPASSKQLKGGISSCGHKNFWHQDTIFYYFLMQKQKTRKGTIHSKSY